MWLIDRIAEARIEEAMAEGAFDDLPGAGRPLPADEAVGVPEELRVAWRVLKNAGYLPPELELRREIASLEALIAQATGAEERTGLSRRLRWLLIRLDESRAGALAGGRYLHRLAARLR